MPVQIKMFLCVAFATLLVSGCGDEENKPLSPAVQACQAHCQAQDEANCGLQDGVKICDQICGSFVGRLSANCQDKAEASFNCNMENDEVCGGAVDTLQCNAETDAYNACLQGN